MLNIDYSIKRDAMRVAELLLSCLVIAMLSSCGKETASPPPATASPPSSVAKRGTADVSATAAQVASAARTNVKCPATNTTAPREQGAPVDDLVGVRPGMTYEEAANVVLCTNELLVMEPDTYRGVQMQTYGQKIRQGFYARFAEAKVQKTSKQIMQEMQDTAQARGTNRLVQDAKPGQSKWYVGTMGLTGKERVISAAKTEWFEDGRNPTIASVEQALREKYGAPSKSMNSGNYKSLTWAYDLHGRPITETSPLMSKCLGVASPDGAANFSADCGVVVAADIYQSPANKELSNRLDVGVVNQAGAYDAITAAEKGLQQMDAQRRANEVAGATKNADKPKL